MAAIEHPNDKNAQSHTDNVLKNFYRIEDGKQGISQWRFETIAEVLGKTVEELKEILSVPISAAGSLNPPGPWITDESVLKAYRTLLHAYSIIKSGNDYYWTYNPIDFNFPYNGCLHAVFNAGNRGEIQHRYYGYLYQRMMVLIRRGNQEKNRTEAVSIFPYFRLKIPRDGGYFGVRLAEDGFGGTLLRKSRFPDTVPGQQSPVVGERLTDYWKSLCGEWCNTLFHLFGNGPFFNAASAESSGQNLAAGGANPSTKQ